MSIYTVTKLATPLQIIQFKIVNNGQIFITLDTFTETIILN